MTVLGLAAIGTYTLGLVFTPEFFEFLTAAMVTVNTILLIHHNRRVKRDVQPKLDHVAETADQVAGLVERRRLDRSDEEVASKCQGHDHG